DEECGFADARAFYIRRRTDRGDIGNVAVDICFARDVARAAIDVDRGDADRARFARLLHEDLFRRDLQAGYVVFRGITIRDALRDPVIDDLVVIRADVKTES